MNEFRPSSDVPPEEPHDPEAGRRSEPTEPAAFASQVPEETMITPGGSALEEEVVFERNIRGDLSVQGVTDQDGHPVPYTSDMDAGIRLVRMGNGLLRMEQNMEIYARGQIMQETAFVVVDENYNIVDDPAYDDPPQESPFTFPRPFDTTYEAPTSAEQLEAGSILDRVHGAAFNLYPNNVRRGMGIASNSIRRKDVVITAATCDPGSDAEQQFGRKYVHVAARKPGGMPGYAVQYSLDADGAARRWDEIPRGPNAEFKYKLRTIQRRDAAEKAGPAAMMEFQQTMAAEIATQSDRPLAAETGTNYLTVSPEEVRALGRFVAQRLGIEDDAWQA